MFKAMFSKVFPNQWDDLTEVVIVADDANSVDEMCIDLTLEDDRFDHSVYLGCTEMHPEEKGLK